MTNRLVLVINGGSSSIKVALRRENTAGAIFEAIAERLNTAQARLSTSDGLERELSGADHLAALDALLPLVDSHLDQPLSAVGHRVVHGGERFTSARQIDDEVIAGIQANAPLAPLHNPANLTGIRAALKLLPDTPQFAVFDTAFHQSMPPHAFRYALPDELYAVHGVRRYGFHGTSHKYVSDQASVLCGKERGTGAWLTAHLGNGCSSCAVLDGHSMDTSMGLTPLEGLVMGTRSGDVDPNLHAHLARTLGWDLPRIEHLLNRESGLLGLSGLSNDMRTLEQASSEGHEGATLAIEVFCYRLAKSLAGQACALTRLDGLIFTGGIGENSALVRAKTVAHLRLMGLAINDDANRACVGGTSGEIQADNSPRILVVPTNEERQIALETLAAIGANKET